MPAGTGDTNGTAVRDARWGSPVHCACSKLGARLSFAGEHQPPPALLILSSAFLAAAGNGISMVAFPWLVLQRTGSAVDASIVAAAATLPLLVATLVAGTAVDFVGRRRVAMLADALSAMSVAAIPVLAITLGTGSLTTVVLAGLAALGSFFDPAGMTARQSMLPEGRGASPVGRSTTPAASTKRCSTWPTSPGRASGAY